MSTPPPQNLPFTGKHVGQDVERQLRAMPAATEAPDLSCSILSQVDQSRPFADSGTRRARRWTRVIAGALAGGVAVCGAVAAVYAPEVIPGMQKKPTPISGVVASWNAERANSLAACRRAPEQLVRLARSMRHADPADQPVVRTISSNLLLPTAVALRMVPSTDLNVCEPPGRIVLVTAVEKGRVVVDRAGRMVSNFGSVGRGDWQGRGEWGGSGTFVDRFERAVGGRETLGPQ